MTEDRETQQRRERLAAIVEPIVPDPDLTDEILARIVAHEEAAMSNSESRKRRAERGGYESSGRPAEDLDPPPTGPAPGSKPVRCIEGHTVTAATVPGVCRWCDREHHKFFEARPNPIRLSPLVVLQRVQVALEEVYPGDQSAEAAALVDQLETVGLRIVVAE